jgi:hypothetical protein
MQSRARHSIKGHLLVVEAAVPRGGTNVYFQRRAGAASPICCRLFEGVRDIWVVVGRCHCNEANAKAREGKGELELRALLRRYDYER